VKDELGRLTVPQIEEKITHLVETDIQNPEIYTLLKQLAYICIYQNKYVYGYSDIEAVCHDVAADTYMRVLSGKTTVTKWMYYVERSIQLSYINNQRKIEHEVINTIDAAADMYRNSKPAVDETSVINMSAGSAFSINNEFDRVKKTIFLQNIDSLLREVLLHTKFKEGTADYLSVYTSVSLSLYFNKMIYFRLNVALKPYIRLIMIMFKKALLVSEFFTNEFEDSDNNLPTLVFYDEQIYKEADKRKDC
jgi:hypothetical protein